jgi:Uncharacterized protein involved in copper resistance
MDGAVGHRQVSGAPIVLEACLDSLDLATAAAAGGAGRIELCDRLDVGGTTPSAELVRAVTSVVDIPVCPIIRPRGGDFVYSASEMETMKREVAAMRDLGAAGIVVGILTRGNEVDHPAMRAIIDAADGLPVGFIWPSSWLQIDLQRWKCSSIWASSEC